MLMGRSKGGGVRVSMGGSTTFQVTLNGGKSRGGSQGVPVRPSPICPAPRLSLWLLESSLLGLTTGRRFWQSGGLMSGSRKKAMGISKGSGAKGSMGGRLGIVKKQPGMGMGGDLRSRLGGGKQQMQMTFMANNMEQQQQQQPQSRADAEDSWGHDMFYKSGYASNPLGAFELDLRHRVRIHSPFGSLESCDITSDPSLNCSAAH